MAVDNPTEPRPLDSSAQVPDGGGDLTNFQPPQTNGGEDLFVKARAQALVAAGVTGEDEDTELVAALRSYVKDAETKYEQYGAYVQQSWSRAYRAFQNKHFDGSKYLSKEFRARSSLFVPKTRAALRKMMAATTASLFSTTDALAITAGNESDPKSRAAAELMQEIVNYRTDRTSGRNSIKWFLTAIGASQDATLAGICVTKQYWRLETKQVGEQPAMEPANGPDGVPQTDPMTGQPVMAQTIGPDGLPMTEPVFKTIYDRPESVLIPPENIIADAGADWRDPVQSAGFFGIRWPMTLDEIQQKVNSPLDPWKEIPEAVLKSATNDMYGASKGVRTSREGGRDRFDSTNRPDEFQTIWVTEWYIRYEGEDYTFFALNKGDHFLTDPKPVEEAYPWNFGDRPITMGYGSLESHKLFPMSPAESWQPLQQELNDVANLILDTTKMNVAPVAVVKRGAQVDLEALRKRGPGTNILANDAQADIQFQKGPGPDASAWRQREQIVVDFDSLAGQFDAGSVQSNRQLNETVGGMRLLTGSANAVGEFDQRVFIETWAEPAIGQIVRLCQFYEHDATILGLCGEKAQLWQKFGVDQITDELLETQVTTRVDIGVGAGDPQQRLAKFQMAVAAAMPLLKGHPDFMSGKLKLDVEAVMQECFGSAGYRDGGKRFITAGDPQQPQPLQEAQLQAEIDQTESQTALNFAKAKQAMVSAKTDAFKVISDFMGGQQDRAMAQQQHGDAMHMQAQQRSDGLQARQEDRGDAFHKQAADRAHQQQAAAMKAPPQAPAPSGPMSQLVQGGTQDIELMRGPDGAISGARIGGMTVNFQRGQDGRIAGMQLGQGGAPPAPPPDMQQPQLPSPDAQAGTPPAMPPQPMQGLGQ